MAASAEEEARIIRKRFLTQTTAISAAAVPPFKKLAKSYMLFCAALEGSGGAEEAEKHYRQLLSDLYVIQENMQRMQAAGDASVREQAVYADKQAQLQESIAQAERDIEERKRQLADARLELAQQQEYEAVKRQIMQVPARATTQADQEAARREIADLQQQSAALDGLFETRKAQFAGILAALEQLQRSIDKDEPEESIVALPEGGAGAAAGGAAAAAGGKAAAQQPMQVG